MSFSEDKVETVYVTPMRRTLASSP